MSLAAASEPGGYLAEVQRRRCAGDSALTTFQGLRVDAIIVRADAVASPEALIAEVSGFADAMLHEAQLLPGEFAAEAVGSFYARDYLAQALSGGHAQYWANRSGDALAMLCAAQALKSMGADAYHEVLATLARLMTPDAKARRTVLKQKRWRNVAAGLRALDDKVRDLAVSAPLAPLHAEWLRRLPSLRALGEDEARAACAAYAAANPLAVRRRDETDARKAERERSDPTHSAVRALTDMARLRFLKLGDGAAAGMRTIWPEGPERRGFVRWVQTDQGPCAAVFYKEGRVFRRYLAVLLEQNGVLPLGSLRLTRAMYEAIAPAYARG
ncbi:MAG TPA: hypothetical protein PKY87_12995 [Terricaulis sp.]|nr:hypothetical protein [Terricaulis sp.]